MKEILLTSSVLILALLVLREVFREKISRRVQYALWVLAALRLLIPVSLPGVDFSVLSAAEPARVQMERRLEENPVYVLPVQREEIPLTSGAPPEPEVILPIEGRYTAVSGEEGQPPVLTSYALTLQEALTLVWITGMGGMAVWMAVSNLRFARMLRKKRIPLELECRYPVFLVEDGIVSPCLFGIFRPAVYLTPGALEDEDSLRHVLAHEETHGRHLDPVWALVRCICLAVYWFDPLVWWAAAASREDCELACDEGALARLGEEQRIPYGQTLLRLIPLRKNRGGVMLAATTMTSDKKRMKERITRIAENRKMKTAALCALLGVVVCVCAVTFTGCTAVAEAPEEGQPEMENVPSSDMPSAVAEPENPEDTITIPLDDLQPWELLPVDGVYVDGYTHHEDRHGGHHGEDYHEWFYEPHMADGVTEDFTGVLGHDGVMVSYIAQVGSNGAETVNDYYVFEDRGQGTEALLLARVYGTPYLLDLNGDGVRELVGTDGWQQSQIYFLRDGQIYTADVAQLLKEHWGRWEDGAWEANYITFLGWSENAQYLAVEGLVPSERDGSGGGDLVARRQLYFDRSNLYLSKYPERRMTGHVLDSVQDMSAVVDAARALVKTEYENLTAHYGDGWPMEDEPPEWDDYCVTGIECVYLSEPETFPEVGQIAVYGVNWEFHSPTPERVIWAGGVYVCEDGWAGGYNGNPYLVFQILDDGTYRLLDNQIPFDLGPGSPMFDGGIATTLLWNRLMQPSEFSGETLFYGAECSPLWFMDALALYSAGEQEAALSTLVAYAKGMGSYETDYLLRLVDSGYEYSEGGAEVIGRLKDLLNNKQEQLVY